MKTIIAIGLGCVMLSACAHTKQKSALDGQTVIPKGGLIYDYHDEVHTVTKVIPAKSRDPFSAKCSGVRTLFQGGYILQGLPRDLPGAIDVVSEYSTANGRYSVGVQNYDTQPHQVTVELALVCRAIP